MADTSDNPTEADGEILRLTSRIVASFVSNNPVPADSLPSVIQSVHKSISALAAGRTQESADRPRPAVPINKSITDDHIICLEDGRKLKMLKRYLRSHYNMTPDDYRRRWGLPADYPMVAPNYAKRRSNFAKEIGLGKGKRTAAKPTA